MSPFTWYAKTFVCNVMYKISLTYDLVNGKKKHNFWIFFYVGKIKIGWHEVVARIEFWDAGTVCKSGHVVFLCWLKPSKKRPPHKHRSSAELEASQWCIPTSRSKDLSINLIATICKCILFVTYNLYIGIERGHLMMLPFLAFTFWGSPTFSDSPKITLFLRSW